MSELPRPYEVRATPGWPPVAVPGRLGWWRHCIDGQQVDLPTNDPSNDDTRSEKP